MLKKIDVRFVLVFVVLLIMALAPGCTDQAEPEAAVEEVAEAVEEVAAAAEEMGEEQMTLVADKLATIDGLDGTVDNIVGKCPGCALQMDGVEDHRLDVAGYQLHFCSAECKDHMGEEPVAAILALVIPE